jgi:acetyl esterase/lipase
MTVEHGIDPKRIGTAGGSSGGHLAALLGTTKERIVQAVAAFNPLLDLPALAHSEGAAYSENPGLDFSRAIPVEDTLEHILRSAALGKLRTDVLIHAEEI